MSDSEGSQVSLGSSMIVTDGGGDGGQSVKRATAGLEGMAPATTVSENTYTIRPSFHLKFRPGAVKEVLRTVLYDELNDKEYDSEQAKDWVKEIADIIRDKMKGLELERYKFIVVIVIGENRGQGTKIAARCLWDSDTDNCAQESYLGDNMFASATVYGVFHY